MGENTFTTTAGERAHPSVAHTDPVVACEESWFEPRRSNAHRQQRWAFSWGLTLRLEPRMVQNLWWAAGANVGAPSTRGGGPGAARRPPLAGGRGGAQVPEDRDRGSQRSAAAALDDLNERSFIKVSLSLPTRYVDRSEKPLAGPYRERSIA